MKLRPTLPPLDTAQRYSIDEAIAYLRSSRKTLFDDIREGRLATIKEGKRRFVQYVATHVFGDAVRGQEEQRKRWATPIDELYREAAKRRKAMVV